MPDLKSRLNKLDEQFLLPKLEGILEYVDRDVAAVIDPAVAAKHLSQADLIINSDKREDIEKAIRMYHAGVRLDPNNKTQARLNYGLSRRHYLDGIDLFRQQQYAKATGEFNKSLNLLPAGTIDEKLLNWLRTSALMSEDFSILEKVGIHTIGNLDMIKKLRREPSILEKGFGASIAPPHGTSPSALKDDEVHAKVRAFITDYCRTHQVPVPEDDRYSGRYGYVFVQPIIRFEFKKIEPFYDVFFVVEGKSPTFRRQRRDLEREYDRLSGPTVYLDTNSKMVPVISIPLPKIRIAKPLFDSYTYGNEIEDWDHLSTKYEIVNNFSYNSERPVLVMSLDIEARIIETLQESSSFSYKEPRLFFAEPLRTVDYSVVSDFLRQGKINCLYDLSLFRGTLNEGGRSYGRKFLNCVVTRKNVR